MGQSLSNAVMAWSNPEIHGEGADREARVRTRLQGDEGREWGPGSAAGTSCYCQPFVHHTIVLTSASLELEERQASMSSLLSCGCPCWEGGVGSRDRDKV